MKQQRRKIKGSNKGTPKQNNRHVYGHGHGTIGKKAARITRMQERQQKGQNKRRRDK